VLYFDLLLRSFFVVVVALVAAAVLMFGGLFVAGNQTMVKPDSTRRPTRPGGHSFGRFASQDPLPGVP
jgi:hypothetical protein